MRISRIKAVGFLTLLAAAILGVLHTASAREDRIAQNVLTASLREIDLGVIGPGEQAGGQFTVAGTIESGIRWTMEKPPGWTASEDGLTGECGAAPVRVDVLLRSLKELPVPGSYFVELRIASGKNAWVLQRALTEGSYREALRIRSDAGSKTVFVKFSLTEARSRPALVVEPRGIDLGDMEPVKEITRRIRISNGAAGVLRWQATTSGAATVHALNAAGRGRYFSLLNEELATGGPYSAPPALKDALQTSGRWIVEKGYPRAAGEGCLLKLQFQGTGAVLYGRKASDEAVLRISIDEHPGSEIPLRDIEENRFERILVKDLPPDLHRLQIRAGEGSVILDGVFVSDAKAGIPPPSWIRLTPLSGTTNRETDFVTIRMNLSELKTGIYTDFIEVASNGGTFHIPISLNMTGDPVSKVLGVYRYTRGVDQLFTSQPEKEDTRYIGAYRREGLAFRLYSPGTAGTIELYRWYNPEIGDHYYSTERSGGRKTLAGYQFEGTIGNIATIRLPGTKELYRWFNASTGQHFFTTDPAGEGRGKEGYRFEGIVGFILR